MVSVSRLFVFSIGLLFGIYAGAYEAMAEQKEQLVAPVILSINVDGNRYVEKETILAKLHTAVGQKLDRRMLSQDVRRLYKTGFFSDVQVTGTRKAEGVHLVCQVKEYPLVAKLELEGNNEVTTKDLKPRMKLRSGRIFSPVNQASDRNTIRKQYLKKGYYQIEVEFKTIARGDGRVDLVINIEEGEITRIKRIQFIGNEQFSDADLRSEIASRQSDTITLITDRDVFDRKRMGADGQLLQQFYLNNGYLDVSVESSRLAMSTDKKSFDLTFSVHEGVQYSVKSIGVQGDLVPDLDTLMELVELREGRTYSLLEMRNSIDAITDRVGDEGYAFATVTPLLNRDINAHTVAVSFDVEKGKEVYIERLEISGNEKTEDVTIRRLSKQSEGERYSGTQVRMSKEAMQRTEYVEDVRVSFPKGSASDRVDMKVDITEKKSGSFSVGAGYSQTEKFMITGNVSENNLFGKGYRASLDGSIGFSTQNYNASLTDPFFLGENLSATVGLFRTQTDQFTTVTYDLISTGGSVGFGIPLSEHISYGITYQYNSSELSGIDVASSLLVLAQQGSQTTGEVLQTISWDSRDRMISTKDGHVETLRFGVAGLGGKNRFWETSVSSKFYIPFGEEKDIILNPSFSSSYIRAYGGREIPLYRRYSIGGIGSMRGFDSAGVTLRDPATGEAIGGDKQFRGSVNLFFPLPYMQTAGFRGLVFADAGMVWGSVSTTVGAVSLNVSEPFSLSRMRYSAGLGFEWLSPVGPLGLVWAFPFRSFTGDAEKSIEFMMGSSF
jgi:outer membrane protein insertion porin family